VSYGLQELELLGAIFHLTMVTGIVCMSVITAGPIKAYGNAFLKPLPAIQIWSTSWLTVALSASIDMVRLKKTQPEQAQGRSRGGLGTKINAAVDALGNPVRFFLTEGQTSEYTQANALI
jgi:hypothetical protein